MDKIRKLSKELKLHTICETAICPNRPECFAQGTATFLILGNVCTRNFTFCAVKKGRPNPPDPEEPEHIVEAVKRLGLQYVVITSVTRDGLPDGGASHFAAVVKAIYWYNSEIGVEVLTSDFKGSLPALEMVITSNPTVFGHNIETVPRLYSEVRSKADYRMSIELLRKAKEIKKDLFIKSGMMVGLGETREEIIEVMKELREADCEILTVGQYLQPSSKHHEVVRFIHPMEFKEYKDIGEKMGFKLVVSGPFVRSSFHAASILEQIKNPLSVQKSSGSLFA